MPSWRTPADYRATYRRPRQPAFWLLLVVSGLLSLVWGEDGACGRLVSLWSHDQVAQSMRRSTRATKSRTSAPAAGVTQSSQSGYSSRWTLADGLGLIVLANLSLWSPWPSVTTSLLTASFVTVGAFACAAFALARWRCGIHPRGLALVPVGLAAGLLAWALTSMILSGAPGIGSLYGATGRNDGALTLIAMALILLSASTLVTVEIPRLMTWILAAGSVLVFESLLQALGLEIFGPSPLPGVWASLGNPNFLAAAAGILSALALARAVDSGYPTWQRLSSGALLLGLAATAVLSLSVQGPVTVAIAMGSAAAFRLLQLRHTLRIGIWVGTLAVGLVGIAVTALGIFDRGPFAILWQGETTGFRKSFWELSLRIAESAPVWGTGPDGLVRYAGEFRSPSYVADQSPASYLDAAHNVPIHVAATLGFPGAVLWLLLFGSVVVVALRGAWRGSAVPPWVYAGVTGAFLGYLAQSQISVDETRLKLLGWLLAGAIIAAQGNSTSSPPTTSRSPYVLSAALALIGILLWIPPAWAGLKFQQEITLAQGQGLVTSSFLPCESRVSLLGDYASAVPPSESLPVALSSYDLDPRCVGMAPLVGQVALANDDLSIAETFALESIRTDPLSPYTWVLVAQVEQARGDPAASKSSILRARELIREYPDPEVAQALSRLETQLANPAGE